VCVCLCVCVCIYTYVYILYEVSPINGIRGIGALDGQTLQKVIQVKSIPRPLGTTEFVPLLHKAV
jgi:hypothetical protein